MGLQWLDIVTPSSSSGIFLPPLLFNREGKVFWHMEDALRPSYCCSDRTGNLLKWRQIPSKTCIGNNSYKQDQLPPEFKEKTSLDSWELGPEAVIKKQQQTENSVFLRWPGEDGWTWWFFRGLFQAKQFNDSMILRAGKSQAGLTAEVIPSPKASKKLCLG